MMYYATQRLDRATDWLKRTCLTNYPVSLLEVWSLIEIRCGKGIAVAQVLEQFSPIQSGIVQREIEVRIRSLFVSFRSFGAPGVNI